jgi:hypothetical protein
MQPFKLQHFAVPTHRTRFPRLRTSQAESSRIAGTTLSGGRDRRRNRLGELYKHLLNRAEHVKAINAEDEDRFNLGVLPKSLSNLPNESLYLAWDPGRGDVDRIAFANLSRYFDWIWYPASEDIVIRSPTMNPVSTWPSGTPSGCRRPGPRARSDRMETVTTVRSPNVSTDPGARWSRSS